MQPYIYLYTLKCFSFDYYLQIYVAWVYELEVFEKCEVIFSIFPTAILSRSSVPDCLPITGYPSTKRRVYSESKPWIWIPFPPPKSGTINIPIWSSKISLSLLELLNEISSSEISFAGRGKVDNCLTVFVADTITSLSLVSSIESL